MGGYRWEPTDWDDHQTTTAKKTTQQIFTSRRIHADLDPTNIKLRESRDSDINPSSTPIIIGGDVTGSMGTVAEDMVRNTWGIAFPELLARKPVSDPHMMFIAIGDVYSDDAPAQMTQFEADIKIVKQMENVYVEGNGGGNGGESYDVAYYLAATRTSIDSFEKRGRKGYIFTYGDEEPHPEGMPKHLIKRFFGDDVEKDMTFQESLDMALRMYHVFHLVIAQGGHARSYGADNVRRAWTPYLGENVRILEDYNAIMETIVSIIEITEGISDAATTASSSS